MATVRTGPCVTAEEVAQDLLQVYQEIIDSGITGLSPGCGIDITAGTISVRTDDTTIECDAGVLKVIAGSGGTYVAGNGLGESPAGTFNVNVDNTTIQIVSDTLEVIGDLTAYTEGQGINIAGHVVSAVPDGVTIGFNVSDELEFLGFGSNGYSGGDGIDITGSTVTVDLAASNPGLEFSSAKLKVKVASDGGIDIQSTGLHDKNRYHLAKGDLNTNVFAGGGVGLSQALISYGELIPTTLSSTSGPDIYAQSGTQIWLVGSRDGGSDYYDQWSTGTANNFPYLLAGIGGFDHDADMLIGHDSGDGHNQYGKWDTIANWLTLLPDYDAGEQQYLKNEAGTIKWVTVSEC